MAGQFGTLSSVLESALEVPFAAPFQFVAAAFVPLFDVLECSAIQIERVAAGLVEGPSRELPRPSRA